MKFSIKDFFSKCDQIRRKLRIWSHLLKKSLLENFIFVQYLIVLWIAYLGFLVVHLGFFIRTMSYVYDGTFRENS